uniref:Uncharacterized protein n=1 Tax=Cucumis melo TaxID=3656 RepID=A0A9I9E2Q7_CUCME
MVEMLMRSMRKLLNTSPKETWGMEKFSLEAPPM